MFKRLAVLAILVLLAAACGDEPASTEPEPAAEQGDCEQGVVTTESGLKIEDLECGTGPEVQRGDTAVVHYTGTLEDGTKFDSSFDHNPPEPFPVTLGAGQVIQGWEEGVPGMRLGGKRRLTIPPELGYGEAGSPPVIPPNATLIFEVTLVDIR